MKPKLIIIHCFNSQHSSFKGKHPSQLWSTMNVGAHYVIEKNGAISQCVPLTGAHNTPYMIRHAGQSNWKNMGQADHEKKWQTLNYDAIGIEIDSSGFVDPLNKEDKAGAYTKAQIRAIRFLVRHLQKRFCILDHDVLAHSDISPYRMENGQVVLGKNDPSESFPWSKVIPIKIKTLPLSKVEKANVAQFLEHALTTIGYDLNRDHAVPFEQKHLALKFCLLAFCRHYAPQFVTRIKTWDGLNNKALPQKLLQQVKYLSATADHNCHPGAN